MSTQTLTLTIPNEIYQQLQSHAQVVSRPLSELAVQILSHYAPKPPIEDDLSSELQAELTAMEQLSDELLWKIANNQYNADKLALYDVLLDQNREEQLTTEGRLLLNQLREESERLMLRKAHAYALLKNRGHQLPTLDELRTQERIQTIELILQTIKHDVNIIRQIPQKPRKPFRVRKFSLGQTVHVDRDLIYYLNKTPKFKLS